MHFFQYRRASDLNFAMLRRGEIFFASASELNDANECRPHLILRGSRELWQRLADYLLFQAGIRVHSASGGKSDALLSTREIGDAIGQLIKLEVKNRDLSIHEFAGLFAKALQQAAKGKMEAVTIMLLTRAVEQIIHDLPKTLREDRYIASFARNALDPTMWGHYADAEKGFLIIYETSDDKIKVHSPIKILSGSRPSDDMEGAIMIGNYSEENLELMPVQYRQKIPKVNAFHGLIPHFIFSEEEDHYDVPAIIAGDAPEKHQEEIGLIKYSSWRYEREIRTFFPTHISLPPDLRSLSVDAKHIKGLVFGPRISESDKARAIFCCHLLKNEFVKRGQTPFAQFGFFQAKHKAEHFKLSITPVGILDDHFFRRAPFTPLKRCPSTVSDYLVETARLIELGK